MTCTTTYTRLDPNTLTGHAIKVTMLYQSQDEEEINALEKELEKLYGSALIVDFNADKKTEERGATDDR